MDLRNYSLVLRLDLKSGRRAAGFQIRRELKLFFKKKRENHRDRGLSPQIDPLWSHPPD